MARILVFIFLVLTSSSVWAHFDKGTQIREAVLAQSDGVARLYVRAPLPLVFADVIARSVAEQQPLESPFLYFEQTGAGQRYRASVQAIDEDSDLFISRLKRSLDLMHDGEKVETELLAFRLSPRRPQLRFDTGAAAEEAMAEPTTKLDPVFGQGVVEYVLTLPADVDIKSGLFSLQSAYPAISLPEGVTIDNHLTLQSGTTTTTATYPGQLGELADFPQTALTALVSFLKLGVEHIVTGLDHVFLVICFALGIGWSRQLLWVITAFTLGHSVTLVMGAAGITPQIDWFIPAIEFGIAFTVVLAAIAAWQKRQKSASAWMPALIAAGIGLIHGFGFASFLSSSLSPGSSAFVPALAGFNIGLEVGQILLVLATVALFALIARLGTKPVQFARLLTLVGIGAVSGYWAYERFQALAIT